jgi:RNA polymerase sigma-70 factor (ECF subfamily)
VPRAEQIEQFTTVYREHYRQVYAYAVARAGRQLADEVVADTFLVAWRRFAVLPQATPLPWLLGVARNIVRERFRAEVRRREIAAELQAWAGEDELLAADVADGVAERAAVLTALAALSEEDRELLTLVAWQGLPPRQAAQVVGCSTATYFVRLHRARRRLQNALDATTGEPAVPRSVTTSTVTKESTR